MHNGDSYVARCCVNLSDLNEVELAKIASFLDPETRTSLPCVCHSLSRTFSKPSMCRLLCQFVYQVALGNDRDELDWRREYSFLNSVVRPFSMSNRFAYVLSTSAEKREINQSDEHLKTWLTEKNFRVYSISAACRCVLQAKYPLQPLAIGNGRTGYFEVTLLQFREGSVPSELIVGLSYPDCSSIPGYFRGSWGIDQDLLIHTESILGILSFLKRTIKIQPNDTLGIGACYDFHADEIAKNCLFITYNGTLIYEERVLPGKHRGHLYPTLSLNGIDKFQCNFGCLPFLFDLAQFQRHHLSTNSDSYFSSYKSLVTRTYNIDSSIPFWTIEQIIDEFSVSHLVFDARKKLTSLGLNLPIRVGVLASVIFQLRSALIHVRKLSAGKNGLQTKLTLSNLNSYLDTIVQNSSLHENKQTVHIQNLTHDLHHLVERFFLNFRERSTPTEQFEGHNAEENLTNLLLLVTSRFETLALFEIVSPLLTYPSIFKDTCHARCGTVEGWVKRLFFLSDVYSTKPVADHCDPADPSWASLLITSSLSYAKSYNLVRDSGERSVQSGSPSNLAIPQLAWSEMSCLAYKFMQPLFLMNTLMAADKNLGRRVQELKPPSLDLGVALLSHELAVGSNTSLDWLIRQYDTYGFASDSTLNFIPKTSSQARKDVEAYFDSCIRELLNYEDQESIKAQMDAVFQHIQALKSPNFSKNAETSYLVEQFELATGPTPVGEAKLERLVDLIRSAIDKHILSRLEERPWLKPLCCPDPPPKKKLGEHLFSSNCKKQEKNEPSPSNTPSSGPPTTHVDRLSFFVVGTLVGILGAAVFIRCFKSN